MEIKNPAKRGFFECAVICCLVTALRMIAIVVVPVLPGEFCIGHPDLLPALLFQETDLPLFFKAAHVETAPYPLDLLVIYPVDTGNFHIP